MTYLFAVVSEASVFVGLMDDVRRLQASALTMEARFSAELSSLHPTHVPGSRNLLHYLALRQEDLRPLQRSLAEHGLSSLGRFEKTVLFTLRKVEAALACLERVTTAESPQDATPTDPASAESLLREHTSELLGPPDKKRDSRIMVTLPIDAERARIEGLLEDGANVFRLNGSKGDAGDWQRLIDDIRAAEKSRGRPCSVLFDLSGPNPRTTDFALGGKKHGPDRIEVGQTLFLAPDRKRALAAFEAHPDAVIMGCSLPDILARVRPGESVSYDDGRVSGIVREASEAGVAIEVTGSRKGRAKVRPDKTLNFPGTDLGLPSLTDKDLRDLDFVVKNADMVGLSFVRTPEDVRRLTDELERRGARELGVVLKIETKAAFNDLPRLLLAVMRRRRVGVMVARGDMAVELGFVRLAEAQEEVLWLGEAALVPVIWATQVLESLNKTGVPTRAEVTDAAMSGRAECVMLNTGDYQRETARFLREILERMQEHQEKKRAMLRRLSISEI